MGANHLSSRENWQMGARVVGDGGENQFVDQLASNLPNHYTVELKPSKLQIYPNGRGVVLDSKVTNTKTGRSLFIEKKTGNNGGNAHERVYKFLSPALKKKVSGMYNTPDNPFFLVFSGDTFQKPKYQNELSLLLEGEEYAVMKPNFTNIGDVASRITEII
jgi:hypothetical protein